MGSRYLNRIAAYWPESILFRTKVAPPSVNTMTANSLSNFTFRSGCFLIIRNAPGGWGKERVDSQFRSFTPPSDFFDLTSEPGIDRVACSLLGAILWLGVATISGTLGDGN